MPLSYTEYDVTSNQNNGSGNIVTYSGVAAFPWAIDNVAQVGNVIPTDQYIHNGMLFEPFTWNDPTSGNQSYSPVKSNGWNGGILGAVLAEAGAYYYTAARAYNKPLKIKFVVAGTQTAGAVDGVKAEIYPVDTSPVADNSVRMYVYSTSGSLITSRLVGLDGAHPVRTQSKMINVETTEIGYVVFESVSGGTFGVYSLAFPTVRDANRNLPTATVIILPYSAGLNTPLRASASGSDDDGNTVTLAYQWYKNGVLQSGQTTETYTGTRAYGDVIRIDVTPSDVDGTGATASDSVTIERYSCGKFNGLREFDIRMFDHRDPSTGVRKAFGSEGIDLNDAVGNLSFELQDLGGMGSGSFDFLADWPYVALAGTERVDVYLWDEIVYRGYIRIAQKNLASPESARPQMYGMVSILDQWVIKRKYAYGCDTDISAIFEDIAQDYVQEAGRFPNITITVSTIGATLREYDARGKSVAQAFNELMEFAPNQAVWGVEFNGDSPIPGDVLYCRPRPTTTGYVIPVGDNVQALTYPVSTQNLVNRIAPLKGGPVAQPNLVTNGGFEEVVPASEDAGNLLLNASFDDPSNSRWTLSGGATIQFNGNGGAFGNPRTGTKWLEIDTVGENATQTVYITNGRHYEFSTWARLESATLCAFLMKIELLDSGASVLATVSNGFNSVSSPALTDTVYKRFTIDADTASYPTCTQIRVTLEGNGGTASNDGVLCDDAGLYEYCAPAQEHWHLHQTGGCTISTYDWASTGPADGPRTGGLCIKLGPQNISTTADTAELYDLPSLAVSVEPNETYTVMVWWHTDGVGGGSDDGVSIGAVSIDAQNVQGTTYESSTFVGSPSNWSLAYLPITTESDTARLQIFVRVRATAKLVYLDDLMLVQGSVPDEVQNYNGFWPGENYERYVSVTDSVMGGGILNTSVGDSETLYGVYETTAENRLVTDLDTAKAYAAGQFNAKALPRVEATLQIFGAREPIKPDGKVRIVNLSNPPDALFPSRVSYSVASDGIHIVAELGEKRADLAQLLRLVAQRADLNRD